MSDNLTRNDHPVEPTAPVFPDLYAMRVNAPKGAGEYQHDELLVFTSMEEPQRGDLVCVHPRNSSAVLMVLDADLAPGMWERMPYKDSPDSTAIAAIVGTVLGTDRHIGFEAQKCWAVHKFQGKADPKTCG